MAQIKANATFWQIIIIIRQLLFYLLVYGSTNNLFIKIDKKIFYRLFIFILSSNVIILASLISKQGVQGLQAFAFSILTINDKHTKQT